MRKIIIYFLCLAFLLIAFSVIGIADDVTLVSVDPSAQIISPGEAFSFDVMITPAVPIKSFELKISFDPSLIHITEVSEGNIFDGYQNFPNLGIIDNVSGRVLDIFDLILGFGNVSTSGSCVSVSGIALNTAGNATIHLYDVGVTNETGYLPILISDGFVEVQHNIVLSNPSPSNGTEGVSKSRDDISVMISHKHGGVFDYSITTSPSIGSISDVNQSNGTKTCLISGLSYDTSYQWTVSVREVDTGNWTNQTFSFITEAEPDGGGGSSGGSGGIPPPPPVEEPENDAPQSPQKPSGLSQIELGRSYEFSTISFDNDGDQIRYRFDWGDGNLSAWSGFIDGNESVTMEYHWDVVSNVTVRAICQDEFGVNSSWSEGLTVVFNSSENTTAESSSFVNFTIPTLLVSNHSLVFNASITSDIDIVSYHWDFGDGSTGTGINPEHQYEKPGTYEVTLVVTDVNGSSFSKTMSITVNSFSESDTIDNIDRSVGFFPWIMVVFGLVVASIVGWMIISNKESIFPWFKRKHKVPFEKSLFDDFSPVDTLIRGVHKIQHISEFFSRSVEKSLRKPFGLYQKNSDEPEDIKSLLQPSVMAEEDDDVFAQPIHDNSAEPVNKFFGKYSHDEVASHIDDLLKKKQNFMREKK